MKKWAGALALGGFGLADLLSTIDRHAGIDRHREFVDFSGRPHKVLPRGQPVRELA